MVFRGLVNVAWIKQGYIRSRAWNCDTDLGDSSANLDVWKVTCEKCPDGTRGAFSQPGDSGAWMQSNERGWVDLDVVWCVC
jgi:hypothetical protein